MELPAEFKYLYKHWPYHLKLTDSNLDIKRPINHVLLEDIITFINKRMQIFENKYLQKSAPFTDDPILQKYKFCNIYRELDKQTIFYHKLLAPLVGNFDQWLLNIMFCRFICKPETISKIGLLSFKEKYNKKVFDNLMDLKSPKYGEAYIFPISVIQKSKYNTREKFFCYYLPKVATSLANKIESFNKVGVKEGLEKLIPIFGFNLKFHLTESLIDIAYQYPQYVDLYKKFPIGPGSMPTMKKLCISDPEATCLFLASKINKQYLTEINYLTIDNMSILLSAENWEGIGCEFRKYTNLLNGGGRKRYYKLGTNSL